VYRDYGPKGVKFFFVYKTLAHPELAGNYVQPFTLDERLNHARQAEKQLGATIPWLVDPIDNRLKHALGDRPNSEFLIDPQGVIVRKRPWSDPGEVREDLEQLVGPVERITREEDVKLAIELPIQATAPRGTLPRLKRKAMSPIVSKPKIQPNSLPFFAKLRAEADNALINKGAGQLYLGFHLDPFHEAHWNNLTRPLSIKLDVPEGVSIEPLSAEAPKVDAASDTDPREFMLNVSTWPASRPIELTVTYFACVGETSCHAVQQQYTLQLRRDQDAGGARGEGAGYWNEDFANQMFSGDRNNDGKLSKTEVRGLVAPHFDKLDVNHDGLLDREEVQPIAKWLNQHHQPGTPPVGTAK
jgi:hypothetical protein